MMKKTAAILLALMLMSLSATALFAQPGMFPPEALEAFAKEPPITQADVDLYLKALPGVPKAMGDPKALEELYTSLGLTEARFSYIVTKIGLSHSLALGITPEQLGLDAMPEVIRPTEEDKALVAKNLEELTRVTLEAQQNAQ